MSGLTPAMATTDFAEQPGDAVIFDYRTVHGARGNDTASRRRVLSLRWVGDDVRYAERPGRTSPPYPGHAMVGGQRLREDWFPVIKSPVVTDAPRPRSRSALRRLAHRLLLVLEGIRGTPKPAAAGAAERALFVIAELRRDARHRQSRFRQ